MKMKNSKKKNSKKTSADGFRPEVKIGKPYVHIPDGAALNKEVAPMDPPKTKYASWEFIFPESPE